MALIGRPCSTMRSFAATAARRKPTLLPFCHDERTWVGCSGCLLPARIEKKTSWKRKHTVVCDILEREECNLEFFKAIERRIVESSRSRHLLTHRRGKILANIWLSREIFKLLVLSVPIAVVPGKECVQYLGRYLSQRKDFSSTIFL